MKTTVNYIYDSKGNRSLSPAHEYVSRILFPPEAEDEAAFCNYLAIIAEKNGMKKGELQEKIPEIFRIIKSDIFDSNLIRTFDDL